MGERERWGGEKKMGEREGDRERRGERERHIFPFPTPQSNNMSGAITVLEACNYAQGNTEKEKLDRGEVLLTLAQKCVSDPAHLTSAYKCIEAVLSSPPGRHINTHLSQCVSDVLKETMATPTQTTPTHVQITPTLISSLSIVKRMVNRNIPLDHNMCTLLVKQLLLSDRKDDALELVEGAVELGWYQCGETTPYSLMLPPTLTRLEIELIIRRHVTVLPRPPSHPLEITFPFGEWYTLLSLLLPWKQ